jgi:hypothetical protein
MPKLPNEYGVRNTKAPLMDGRCGGLNQAPPVRRQTNNGLIGSKQEYHTCRPARSASRIVGRRLTNLSEGRVRYR